MGGEGQACSADGRCGVGLICDDNVCQVPAAGAGGASAIGGEPASESDGGSAGEASQGAGGAGSGGVFGLGGKGVGAEDGAGVGGGQSPSEAGGAKNSGGASSGGGSAEAGGSGSGGAPLGPNLLENGDFEEGDSHWKLDGGNGSFHGIRDGAYCIEADAELDFGLSAPGLDEAGQNEEPFPLESGTTYVLSYRVRGALSWTAKVGLADSPYTAFGEWQESQSQTSSFQSFVHTFTVAEGNERVGFIFQGRGQGEFCFDDVVLASRD